MFEIRILISWVSRIIWSFLFLLFVGGSSICSAQDRLPLSARRAIHEDYHTAIERNSYLFQSGRLELDEGWSAIAISTPYDQIDTSRLPEWSSIEEVQTVFQKILNDRFLESPDDPRFMRRIPWLYLEDGCFMRAHSVVQRIRSLGRTENLLPSKIFIFGNLVLHEKFLSTNTLNWWFHVAPAVKVKGDVYILDPAVEVTRPLLLRDWISQLSSDVTSVEVSVCDTQAYDAFSPCHSHSFSNFDRSNDQRFEYDTFLFLEAEKDRILELGLSIDKILGDSPPWH